MVPATVSAQPSQSPVLEIRDFDFSPAEVRIPRGTTVRWVNRGQIDHTATSDTGVWDSGWLKPGQSYSRRFDQAGEYPYHCTPHPFMKGTVIVR